MATSLAKANLLLKAFGTLKVPMIGYCRPRIVESDAERVVVHMPLSRRTKNHLRSMYFGALSVGADVAAGWAALDAIEAAKAETGRRIDFVFKDVHGEFLRRPDADVHFTCAAIPAARALIARALESGERENATVDVVAHCPKRGDDAVANFALTMSVKARS